MVVGYGTQKKVNLTGAVSAITNEELAATKSQNAQNMLTKCRNSESFVLDEHNGGRRK